MKNLIKVCVILVVFVSFSGCSWFGGGGSTTEILKAPIPYMEPIIIDKQTETILEYAFVNSPVPWDSKAVEEIKQARYAIAAMGVFLKDSIDLNSSLPWYKLRASHEFIVNQYNIIQKHLDVRDKIRDALGPQASSLYKYVKRDINNRLELQRLRIDTSEKTINDNASSASIKEMIGLFELIQPLIGMAF